MRGTLLKLVAAALMVFAVSAQAQDGVFTLDHVNGQLAAGKLPTDNQLDFIIGINNNTGGNVDGITNGFRVYSPDGACWTSLTGDTPRQPERSRRARFRQHVKNSGLPTRDSGE